LFHAANGFADGRVHLAMKAAAECGEAAAEVGDGLDVFHVRLCKVNREIGEYGCCCGEHPVLS